MERECKCGRKIRWCKDWKDEKRKPLCYDCMAKRRKEKKP